MAERTTPGDSPDDALELTINGKSYVVDPDDLELGEVEVIEDLCGCAIDEVDWKRARAVRAVAFIVLHRANPAFTLEDAARMKISSFGPAEAANGNGNGARPTSRASKTKGAAS